MRRRSWAGLLVLASGFALAAVGQEDHEMAGDPPNLFADKVGVSRTVITPHTPEQEATARAVGREIVCLCATCPKRTITDCDCGWAGQNQIALINAVAKGMTREEIIATWRSVYGDKGLAMLPNEGINVLAWALPYAGAVLGLAGAFFVGRRLMRGRAEEAPAPAPAPAAPGDDAAAKQLARELEDLD